MEDEPKTFNKGDQVEADGEYICVPCGFKKKYQKGENFSECLSCMAGAKEGPEEYAEGMELWEKL